MFSILKELEQNQLFIRRLEVSGKAALLRFLRRLTLKLK